MVQSTLLNGIIYVTLNGTIRIVQTSIRLYWKCIVALHLHCSVVNKPRTK